MGGSKFDTQIEVAMAHHEAACQGSTSAPPTSPACTVQAQAQPDPLEAQRTKLLASIAGVAAEVGGLTTRLERIPDQLSRHLGRLSAALWRARVGQPHESAYLAGLVRASERVAYDAGLVGEALLLQLCKLDAVLLDCDIVRAARKDTVVRIKTAMQQSDETRAKALRLRAGRLTGQVSKLVSRANKTETQQTGSARDAEMAPAPNKPPAGSASSPGEKTRKAEGETEAAAMCNESEDEHEDEEHKESEDDEQDEDQEDISAPAGSVPAPAPVPAAPVPAAARATFSPTFKEVASPNGAVSLVALLPGVAKASLSLTLDANTRSLTIKGTRAAMPPTTARGYKLVQHPFFGVVQVPASSVTPGAPEATFEETFQLPASLHADAARITWSFEGHQLVVTIPRAPAPAPRPSHPASYGCHPLRFPKSCSHPLNFANKSTTTLGSHSQRVGARGGRAYPGLGDWLF